MYALGTYTNAALMYERADNTGSPTLMTTDSANHFDGNPAWAPLHPALLQGKPATITGTDHRDTLTGTSHRDVIVAFDGNDTIKGRAGNDLLYGGRGKDRLEGGDGNDKLLGGLGTDTCIGGPGADVKAGCEK